MLGLTEHETLFVGHNDEPHPHIHVIVNRVHPETGIAAKLSKDQLKLSAWAEEFEKRHGEILCEQRVENNARRRQGEFVKDYASQHAAEFHRWQRERTESQFDRRAVQTAALDARHERQRDLLRIERDRRIEERRKRIRDATRADWRDLYAIQKQERGRLDAAQSNAWTRLRHFVRTHGDEFRTAGRGARKEMLKGAFRALVGSKRQYADLEQKQLAERKAYGRVLKVKAEELTKPIRKDHVRQLAELQKRQEQERHELRMRQSEQSQEQAREIKEGRDREVFRRERQEKRAKEVRENKEEIAKRLAETPKRGVSLRDRFKAAQRDAGKHGERSATGGEESKGQGKPVQPRDSSTSRHKEFKEEARDVTEKKQRGKTPREGSLADKFKKARDLDPAKSRTEERHNEVRENTKDIELDAGRERGRSIKPPSRKPD